jgi:GNAT superfamily N-acetyltransferase
MAQQPIRVQARSVEEIVGGREFPVLRDALAEAFLTYPLLKYALATDRLRRSGTRSIYGAFVRDGLRHGQVFSTAERCGVACWLGPGTTDFNFWRQLRAGMGALPWTCGLRGLAILEKYDQIARRLHHEFAPGPHWYLSAIGVRPAYQGQGIGPALMQPILKQADAAGLPCYLETHDEKNVAIYERQGFLIATREVPPKHPVPVWAMVREPRAPGAMS